MFFDIIIFKILNIFYNITIELENKQVNYKNLLHVNHLYYQQSGIRGIIKCKIIIGYNTSYIINNFFLSVVSFRIRKSKIRSCVLFYLNTAINFQQRVVKNPRMRSWDLLCKIILEQGCQNFSSTVWPRVSSLQIQSPTQHLKK